MHTWWQTETGMILVTQLPEVSTLKPGSGLRPFLGAQAAVLYEAGYEVAPGTGAGYLVIASPWPAKNSGSRLPNQHIPWLSRKRKAAVVIGCSLL